MCAHMEKTQEVILKKKVDINYPVREHVQSVDMFIANVMFCFAVAVLIHLYYGLESRELPLPQFWRVGNQVIV